MLERKAAEVRKLVSDIVNSGNREQEAADIIEEFIESTINEQVSPSQLILAGRQSDQD